MKRYDHYDGLTETIDDCRSCSQNIYQYENTVSNYGDLFCSTISNDSFWLLAVISLVTAFFLIYLHNLLSNIDNYLSIMLLFKNALSKTVLCVAHFFSHNLTLVDE